MASERIDTEGTEHGGELEPERLAEMLEADEVELIDVRRPHEWEAGRIPGARRVEVNDLPALAEELDRERPVVFYCRSGSRSQLAADALRAGGFDSHALAGGISAWSEEGRRLDPKDGYVAESGEAAALLEAKRRNT
jgi:rhodanese-related sulfurtransferase